MLIFKQIWFNDSGKVVEIVDIALSLLRSLMQRWRVIALGLWTIAVSPTVRPRRYGGKINKYSFRLSYWKLTYLTMIFIPFQWTVNGQLRVGFFTSKAVTAGTELTFDYQFQRYGYCFSVFCAVYVCVAGLKTLMCYVGICSHRYVHKEWFIWTF